MRSPRTAHAFNYTALASRATEIHESVCRRYTARDIGNHFVGQALFGGSIVAVDHPTRTIVVADGYQRSDGPVVIALRVSDIGKYAVGQPAMVHARSSGSAGVDWRQVHPVALNKADSTIFFDKLAAKASPRSEASQSGWGATPRLSSSEASQSIQDSPSEASPSGRQLEILRSAVSLMRSPSRTAAQDEIEELRRQHQSDLAKIEELEHAARDRDRSGNTINEFVAQVHQGVQDAHAHCTQLGQLDIAMQLNEAMERCSQLEQELVKERRLAHKASKLQAELTKQKEHYEEIEAQKALVADLQQQLSKQKEDAQSMSDTETGLLDKLYTLESELSQHKSRADELARDLKEQRAVNLDLEAQMQEHRASKDMAFELELELKKERLKTQRD